VSVGVGPVWWGPLILIWYYSPAPVVVAPAPYHTFSVSTRLRPARGSPRRPLPVAGSSRGIGESFWYYCPNAKAYYPKRAVVDSEPWVRMAPR